MATMDEARRALGAYFGYPGFRPGQERLIEAVLSGRDALGVMPTGAGKSICYQVPSLVLGGITIVVSPLVSLMADQVRSLLAVGAHPSYLNSTLTPSQQATVLRRAADGWYQIMYVAPERLRDPAFRAFARAAASPGGIGVPLIAVDEAHCVSQWGQDFRSSYLEVADFVAELARRPVVVALTATATGRVRADIEAMLRLDDPVTVVTGFNRPNLFFGAEEMPDSRKTEWIADFVRARPGESGIVYCATRRGVDELAASLSSAIPGSVARIGRYHAGLDAAERERAQRAFIEDELEVIVATNAFGMGIDKPSVRYVIHHNVPESIEAYYQEAGRAGRDGDPATCQLLWNGNDFRIRRYLIEAGEDEADLTEEERERARSRRFRLLSAMEGYCRTTGCLRNYMLSYFGDDAASEEGCGACSNCTDPMDEEDATELALAAMRTVSALRGRFGVSVVAEVARGADTRRVRDRGLDRSPGFGTAPGAGAKPVADVIRQLIGRGYLVQSDGDYPVVGLSRKGADVLERDGEGFSFSIKRRRRVSGAARPARSAAQVDGELAGADAELFERLRVIRLELAREHGLAPYMVFSDRTLRGMCRLRPRTRDELLEVWGVGKKKAEDFGEAFIDVIASFERDA